MNEFQKYYHQFQEVWLDCYFGYHFTENLSGVASRETLDEFFTDNRVFDVYEGFDVVNDKGFRCIKSSEESLGNLDVKTLIEISREHGEIIIVKMIDDAIHYSSHINLPPGENSNVARRFFEEFQDPRVFTNISYTPGSGGYGYNSVTGSTFDIMVCCIDEKQIGFVLCAEDE